jgi:hypothetical protein
LQDDSKSLKDYGLKAGTKIMILAGPSAAGSVARQEAHAKEEENKEERLRRLKKTAEAMAARSGG